MKSGHLGVFVIILLLFTAIPLSADETDMKTKGAISSKWKTSLGLIGVGYHFLHHGEGELTPNFGPFFRISYPLFWLPDAEQTRILDIGFTAYMNGIQFEDKTAYALGAGLSLGIYKEMITVSAGGSWIFGTDISKGVLTIIVTSNSLKF